VLKQLGPDAGKVKALFITLDPKRDSAQVVAEYLKNFDSRLIGLVGTPEAVTEAKKGFRLDAESFKTGDQGDYLIDHPAIFYLMGRDGRFLKTFPSRGDAAAVAREIKKSIN
jgi:protein SCO1/2